MITEQHLYLALEAHRIAEEGTKLEGLAMDSILIYATHKLAEEGGNLDDDNIVKYAIKLTTDHIVDHMISEDLLHEDFDGVLQLTDKGEEHCIRTNGD